MPEKMREHWEQTFTVFGGLPTNVAGQEYSQQVSKLCHLFWLIKNGKTRFCVERKIATDGSCL